MLIGLMCMKKTKKKKLPPADVIPEHNYLAGKGGCKESDCSSNKSDMKINRENEYLETCSARDNDNSINGTTKIPLNTFGVSLSGGVPDFRYLLRKLSASFL